MKKNIIISLLLVCLSASILLHIIQWRLVRVNGQIAIENKYYGIGVQDGTKFGLYQGVYTGCRGYAGMSEEDAVDAAEEYSENW